MRSINQILRKELAGEKRVLGRIGKIDCGKVITYSVKVDNQTLLLSSKDFQALTITTFIPDAGDTEVGCTSNISSATALITYRPATDAKSPTRGELVAIEFVPNNFRFIDVSDENAAPTYVVEETGPPAVSGDAAEQRRKMMMDAIRERVRKPADGERRELGFIERTECTNKAFMYMKTGTQILKLLYPQTLVMGGYTPDVENLQMGCGMKSVDIPVVFVYKPDTKGKVNGELVSLEFVPKGFTLE